MGQTRVDSRRWAGEWVRREWIEVDGRGNGSVSGMMLFTAFRSLVRAVVVVLPVPCPCRAPSHPPCVASCPACRSSPCSKSSGSRRTTLWRRWRSFSSSLCTGAERLLLTRSRTWTLPPSERAHPPITAHIWPRILRCIAGVTQPCPVDGSLTHPHLITGAYPQ